MDLIPIERKDGLGVPAGGPAPPPPVEDPPALQRRLEEVIEATWAAAAAEATDLDQFHSEPSPWRALAWWLDRRGVHPGRLTGRQLTRLLSRDIAGLDALLTRQVNAILHHPAFQKLEASWRGLRYLVEQVPEGENIKVRVLNVSWKELTRDLDRALEFDQSQLFRKVYGEEFGTPGGEPFGVLLGDYEIHNKPGPDHPFDDTGALVKISAVAAAAFAPFIAGAHPSLLELICFTELERPSNLSRTFEQVDYLKWRALRQTEDARFLGLTLPRVLMRLPYGDDNTRKDGFRFREDVEDPDRRGFLWGNASYAFGAVLVRAFADCGWFAEIRGVPREAVGGGLVTGLPVYSFHTDKTHVAPRSSTNVNLTDLVEKDLSEFGFIPLCHCPDTELAAFYSNPSLQRPQVYDEVAATMNARLSAMLQYMLCVGRFAHYLKVLARDKIGSIGEPRELEELLHRWLLKYVLSGSEDSETAKAQYPLRDAKVQVREHPGKPGSYLSVIHLQPHFQLDVVTTGVRLTTELNPLQPR
jgi:type VI secretion system ImpC/EvpB family protein